MPRSSLLITTQPTDPLPLYTRHAAPDPETSSVHSSAPSYISAAPSYHSSAPRHHHSHSTPNATVSISNTPATPQRVTFAASPAPSGLPSSSSYAPGFRNRAHSTTQSRDLFNGSVDTLYNINEWSPITDSLQSRHYQNVANRRATVASENLALSAAMNMNLPPQSIHSLIPRDTPGERHSSYSYPSPLTPLSSPSSSTFPSLSPTSPLIPDTLSEDDEAEDSSDPLTPHEDPHLVGEVAAARARQSRIYMAKELAAARKMQEEDLMLKQETRTWDFMIAQMSDWEERERSWKKFRNEVGRTRLLGRRLGLRR
jgi:hypothetical protein